jgi:hypothetical protein
MADPVTIELASGIDVAKIEDALEERRDDIEQNVRGLGGMLWPAVRERIAIAVRDKLGGDLMPWIAGAWTTAVELHKFTDSAAYPPDTDTFYDMAPHEIEGVIHPVVTIRCGGAKIHDLRFDAAVKAKFDCVALVIRDAEITGFCGGEYAITLQIGVEGSDLGQPIELAKSRLPGRFTFARSLPIP